MCTVVARSNKRIMRICIFALMVLLAQIMCEQGNNTGMGGDEQDSFPSLAERVMNIEKNKMLSMSI